MVGLDAIEGLWDEDRDGPDEVFTMTSEVVACSGDTGVARVLVRYGDPLRQEYLDLWVVRFAADGRAARFEEWPFWPTHGRSPKSVPPVVAATARPAARSLPRVGPVARRSAPASTGSVRVVSTTSRRTARTRSTW